MIDIHAHILPGVDDGPPDLETSLTMLRLAARTGTTDIVATPHASLQFPYDPETIRARLVELRNAAGDSIRIHSGCDLQLHYENIQRALAHPETYSINGRGYLLVELSDLMIPRNLDEIFAELRAAGLSPILTHPERNPLLEHRLEELEAWVEQGLAIQITAQSLFGRFGGSARTQARKLLERNLVHFIASDAHDPEDRTPRLDEAWRWLERNFGPDYARILLEENPRAALYGEAIQRPPARGRRPRFWWLGLRRRRSA
jgi:protein-tyrosine phosphatase